MAAPAVQISRLTKDFSIGLRGLKLRAVDALDLCVEDNQVYGLLGPNGSGKSTTLKVILGLVEATGGTVSVYGKPSGSAAARRSVGFLPEAPYFYRYLSGRELVSFYARLCDVPRREIAGRTREMLALVGMEDAADRRVGTYSKGMLQRIGLAQALVHDPRLLILDEPTAGVDPVGSATITRLIRELKERGKTILLCSHLLSQVESVCDRVAIMNRGRLVREGQVDTLLTRQDRRSLLVENLSDQARAEIEAVLARHGARLAGVESPRVSLDQVFLEEVAPKGDYGPGEVPPDNLTREKPQ